ncbi:MAG: helix-turn-helix transcriptional regulator [Ectothiorhodospiraceae bacterium]|nr:helix-turn-helix transcriptional regulator [Ectothiorhodospiraceae bacterium]
MKSLLEQIKERRLALGLKQKDMMLRIGVSRQQYQHVEAKGNPRLNTLELISKGLNSELMLIPSEKLSTVLDVLENDEFPPSTGENKDHKAIKENTLANDPWKDLLEAEAEAEGEGEEEE